MKKSNNKKEIKNKKKNSKIIQDLIGVKKIDDKYILTDKYRYFIKIYPTNLSIYEYNEILIAISCLKSVIDSSGLKSFEMFVTDKAESLESNIEYIESLIEIHRNRGNQLEVELLEDDLNILNGINSFNNSSREFFFIYETDKEDNSLYLNIVRCFETNGFRTETPSKNELKNISQVYLERNFSNVIVDDYDIGGAINE